MKLPVEAEPFNERGGKPSVRELLSLVDFNPLKGIIEFNGARIVMQRANVGHLMRRELRTLLGEEQTRRFLMRQGYLAGRSDAHFVRENWPNLDIGDAFTAGTRLHTFTGTVRVETVHNDFDFKTKRFAGEFIWHDSVEAGQIVMEGLQTAEACCWTLVGYASGYATAFFGKPILYKELSCIAQGRSVCRVVGKPLEEWSSDDPAVKRFRDHVLSGDRQKPLSIDPGAKSADPISLPVQDALMQRLGAGLPCVLCGPADSGRRRALESALKLEAARPSFWQDGAHLTSASLREIDPGTPLLIDGPERCPRDVQTHLSQGRIRFHAISELSPERLRGDQRLASAFFNILAVGAVEMQSFQRRTPANRRDVVGMLASQLPQPTAPHVLDTLALDPQVSGLSQITAILRLCQLTGCDLPTAIARISRPAPDPSDDPRLITWIDDVMARGTLDLDALERRIRLMAIERENGNLAAAARRLGLTRAQLAYRIKSDPTK